MKLGAIFADKDMTAEAKVEGIVAVIAKAREAYGNVDMEITEPTINTCNGVMKLSMLDAEDKVKVASKVYDAAKIVAMEASEREGAVVEKAIEEFLATSDIMCNLGASVDSEYL